MLDFSAVDGTLQLVDIPLYANHREEYLALYELIKETEFPGKRDELCDYYALAVLRELYL